MYEFFVFQYAKRDMVRFGPYETFEDADMSASVFYDNYMVVGPAKVVRGEPFAIVCPERSVGEVVFWKRDENGYTADIEDVALYSEKDALKIHRSLLSREHPEPDFPVMLRKMCNHHYYGFDIGDVKKIFLSALN